MFRYEIGAHILVKRQGYLEHDPIEVKIIARAPNMIKARIISDGWFKVGEIRWLTDSNWFSVGRVR